MNKIMGSVGLDRRRNVKGVISAYKVNKVLSKDKAYVYKFTDFDNFSFRECRTVSEASDMASYDDKVIYKGEFIKN